MRALCRRRPGTVPPAPPWCRPAALLPLLAAALLAACGGGGGDGPIVNNMSATPVAYGRITQWSVSGLKLEGAVGLVITEGRCDGIAEAGAATPTQRIFTCRPASLGTLVGEVHDGSGKRLARLRVDVPAPVVRLTLAQGTIDLELDPTGAPLTVDNFLAYVGAGFYDATLFHRVIAGFVIQGGGYTPGNVVPASKAPTRPPIVLESAAVRSNLRGTLAMARTGEPDSATSQYFINLVDNAALDYQSATQPGYAVFGRVTAGLDVVDAIAAVPTRAIPAIGLADVPATDVVVTTARQIR
jgi:cyclophilin family peptidyl-prolyl cis-trans isomerase